MKKIIWFTLLLFTISKAVGQSNPIDIQYITIENNSLIKYVNEVVQNEIAADKDKQFFKKSLGYINVFVSDYLHGDTILKVNILPDLSSFKENTSDKLYPAYYSLINSRPVLLYIKSVQHLIISKYSSRSKKRFRKWLEPYLEKAKDMQFYNEDGSKAFRDKNFRIDYYFQFGEGKDYYIIRKTYD